MSQNSQSESLLLEALKGRRLGPYLSHNPVSATQIWQWCSVMGDNSALYRPGDNQVAPPAMVQMWTMRDVNDCYAPGSTAAPPYRVFDEMAAIGYPANVAVSYDISFYRYLRTGERAKHFTTVANISDRKTTALGTGYFVTERVEYLTVDDSPFAEALITYFQYAPAVANGKRDVQVGASSTTDVAQRDMPAPSDRRAPDKQDRVISALAVGDALPELVVPITHRLIVAGALASQDFTPVHHNVPAAQAAGMPDIFMNILTTCGLSVRYLTDWAGADSRLKQIKFKLMAPNLPGDVMRLRGEVIAVNADTSGTMIEIAFTGQNRRGVHISGTASLAMPHSR
jgi:acyl dehydratase